MSSGMKSDTSSTAAYTVYYGEPFSLGRELSEARSKAMVRTKLTD
jgi:hypothetical protein